MRSQSRTTTDDPAGTGPAAAATDVAGTTASTATSAITAITGVTQKRERDLIMSNLLSPTVRGYCADPSRCISRRCAGRRTSPVQIRLLTALLFRGAHEMPVNGSAVNRKGSATPTPGAAHGGQLPTRLPQIPRLSSACRRTSYPTRVYPQRVQSTRLLGSAGSRSPQVPTRRLRNRQNTVRDVIGSHGWLACGCHAMPVHSGGSTARPSIKRGSLPSAFMTQSSRPEVRAAICVPSGDQAAARVGP